ncbi:MAG: type II CRISPR RNA-guided endonuclease Cas9 [Erysipelotrichaceae bacterium]
MLSKLKNFTVGYDIGITSVGWAIMDNETNNLVDFGTRSFEQATAASAARLHRSARRGVRRKKWRLQQLKDAFVDFELISNEELYQDIEKKKVKDGYLTFSATHKNGLLDVTLDETSDDSVYHLRKRALSEKISNRELLMALHNIIKTRGHFLLETVDFTKAGSLTPTIFYQKFYDLAEQFIVFIDKENLEKEILSKMYVNKVSEKDLKANIKKFNFVDVEDDEFADNRLLLILKLLNAYKADLKKIDESIALESAGNKNIIDLKKNDKLNDFLLDVVDIYDMLEVSKILKDYNFLCEKHVAEIDRVAEIQKIEFLDPDKYNSEKKSIQDYMNIKDLKDKKKDCKKLKVIKNIKNVYPNGLYVKEVVAILKNQQKYNEKITDKFIEVCSMITKARIPYYIGPLSKSAKNSWLEFENSDKFKYSYEFSAKSLINEHKTLTNWKNAMISRCSYLPDEYALPKGSFLSELFVILNELNYLTALDKNDQRYYLTKEDKFKVIDECFLKNKIVSFSDVSNLLGLNYFGIAKESKSKRKKFNKNFSVYHALTSVLEELKVTSIEDVIKDIKSIEKLEDVINSLCLYDEELSKKNYFINEGYSESQASKLSRINTKDYMSLSKKFITEAVMDEDGHSLLEKLFEDNREGYTNEQMTIITRACDRNGEMIDYSSNKYEKLLSENNELGMHLLMDKNKPLMPIARPVIRALNQCFKIHSAIIDLYGEPSRVVIETARDMKDMESQGKETARHFDKMEKLHKYLLSQLREKKVKKAIEKFADLENYLIKNKRKIELYIRQNGKCLITGNTINIHELKKYEIDHILPRGFGDNSMNNSLLMHRNTNKRKDDRTPIEYIRSTMGQESEKAYKERVYQLLDMKMISEEKKDRLFLENQEDALGFVQRNLVDTRYIIKEFTAILNAYSKVHQQETKYVSLKAGFTGMYRNIFNLRKNRKEGLQHHAHDAAIIIVVDKVLNTIYPNYESRGNNKYYSEYLRSITSNDRNENSTDKNKSSDFIKMAYYKAFGEAWFKQNSFINQIKESVPLVSYKVEKKFTGELFNTTIYGKDTVADKDDSPLKLIGVNKPGRSFSSVKSVAVDVFKLTMPNGKKRYFSVHIPKVIVNQKGLINQEQYLTLVKEHYKYNELIDENGQLIKGTFRMRLYKGDIYYDTVRLQPMYFNVGGIGNKRLDVKIIEIFSYNEIDYLQKKIKDKFKEELKSIRVFAGSKDEKTSKILEIKQQIAEYYNTKYFTSLGLNEKMSAKIKDVLFEESDIYEGISKSCYLINILKKTDYNILPPDITGQNMPVLPKIDKHQDRQYVKLVYSPLGIRINKNKGSIAISGPKNGGNHYKMIKKEDFSWQL